MKVRYKYKVLYIQYPQMDISTNPNVRFQPLICICLPSDLFPEHSDHVSFPMIAFQCGLDRTCPMPCRHLRSQTSWVFTPCATDNGTSRLPVPQMGKASTRDSIGCPTGWKITNAHLIRFYILPLLSCRYRRHTGRLPRLAKVDAFVFYGIDFGNGPTLLEFFWSDCLTFGWVINEGRVESTFTSNHTTNWQKKKMHLRQFARITRSRPPPIW